MGSDSNAFRQKTEAIEDTLARMARAVETIDRATPEVNACIVKAEGQIKATNVKFPFVFERPMMCGWRLAWAKVGQEWRLAVYENGGAYEPLVQAPRHVRIDSIDYLPLLIRRMADHAEELAAVAMQAVGGKGP